MGDNKGIKSHHESDEDDNISFTTTLPLKQGDGNGSPKVILKSPVFIKPNSGQISISTGGNVELFEETCEKIHSFASELGGDTECENALKEATKLMRGSKVTYGSGGDLCQSTESDVIFVDKIDALVTSTSFGGKGVFKDFISGDVNIEGMFNFLKELLEVTSLATVRAKAKIGDKIDVTVEKIQCIFQD